MNITYIKSIQIRVFKHVDILKVRNFISLESYFLLCQPIKKFHPDTLKVDDVTEVSQQYRQEHVQFVFIPLGQTGVVVGSYSLHDEKPIAV